MYVRRWLWWAGSEIGSLLWEAQNHIPCTVPSPKPAKCRPCAQQPPTPRRRLRRCGLFVSLGEVVGVVYHGIVSYMLASAATRPPCTEVRHSALAAGSVARGRPKGGCRVRHPTLACGSLHRVVGDFVGQSRFLRGFFLRLVEVETSEEAT